MADFPLKEMAVGRAIEGVPVLVMEE